MTADNGMDVSPSWQELKDERDNLIHRLAKAEEEKQDNSALAHWAGWKTRALKAEAERDALSRDLDAERYHRQAVERSEQAMAAYMERLHTAWRQYEDSEYCSENEIKAEEQLYALMEEDPATSLARLKAEWQADALEALAGAIYSAPLKGECERWMGVAAMAMRHEAENLRRQSKGGEP